LTEPASIRTLGIGAEDELERFFALSNDLLCVARSDGYFLRVNPAFERVLGYTAAELTSRSFLELVHPDDVAATEAELEGLARGVESVAFENRYRRRDGAYRWLQWSGMPDYAHGVVYAVARDVTDARLGEAELRTLAAGQSALRRVATLVARDGDHSEVFRLVTEEVGRLLGAESASIVRFHPGDRGVVIGGWSLPDAPRLPPGSTLELDEDSVAGRVFRRGEAARIEGFAGPEGTLARRLGELGFRSAVGAPIVVEDELWGALVASSAARERWADDAEKRLSDFAELVTQALANADARDQLAASRARLVAASDAERRRLERNLHDGAQQRLVTLALLLRRARKRLAAGDAGIASLLDAAADELDRALAELRELANGLHPAVLSNHGLRPALAAVAERAAVPVQVVGVPDERLPHSAEVAAYYLVSEALTNVAKYAEATAATVAVACDAGHVTVEVRDDGVGGADASGGSGLRGLADRISALGGTLVVDSPPGSGTTVRAEIPV
jgi:PAS domain S-box-containing protein